MTLTFSKSKQTITVDSKVIPAWSKVRNELNKLRALDQVVMTEPEEHPYYPRVFPDGVWTVYAPVPRSTPYLSPFFIPTDAWQMVDTWTTEEGKYHKRTGQKYRDAGYGLHYSTSGTTLGCIRIGDRVDLEWLVSEIGKALARKEKVTLEVGA